MVQLISVYTVLCHVSHGYNSSLHSAPKRRMGMKIPTALLHWIGKEQWVCVCAHACMPAADSCCTQHLPSKTRNTL